VRPIQKWSPFCLPIVLIVGIFVGWMVAQQARVTPSEAQGGPPGKLPDRLSASSAPPGLQKLEEMRKQGGPPAEKRASNTREGVLERLRGSRSGNAQPASSAPPPEVQKLREARKQGEALASQKKGPNTREGVLERFRNSRSGNAQLASSAPPPEVQKLKKGGAPSGQTPRQQPTKEGLLEKIRNQPGGPEMIEEAKKRGARIGMGPVEPRSSLSWLDLFRVKEAEAQGSFSLTLNPGNKWSSSQPYGEVAFLGAYIPPGVSSTTYVMLLDDGWNFDAQTNLVQPWTALSFSAPSDGWYIVNFEASGAQASLKHYDERSNTYPTVASWNYSDRTGTQSYPALVELKAGNHYFSWVGPTTLRQGIIFVYEANVFNLF
jgi:hypothetical protein